MKPHVVLLSLTLVTVTAAGWSDEPFQLEDGFVRLDNGRDLSGWVASRLRGDVRGDRTGWSVVDGAIHLDADKARFSLFSEKTHSDNVVIRLQFRASYGADSGLFVHGRQFQVRDYPHSAPGTKQYAPYANGPGQWNDLELDVTGGVAVVRLNGHVIARNWKIGDDASKGLGLQKEKGDFDFRYIRVKEKS